MNRPKIIMNRQSAQRNSRRVNIQSLALSFETPSNSPSPHPTDIFLSGYLSAKADFRSTQNELLILFSGRLSKGLILKNSLPCNVPTLLPSPQHSRGEFYSDTVEKRSSFRCSFFGFFSSASREVIRFVFFIPQWFSAAMGDFSTMTDVCRLKLIHYIHFGAIIV